MSDEATKVGSSDFRKILEKEDDNLKDKTDIILNREETPLFQAIVYRNC